MPSEFIGLNLDSKTLAFGVGNSHSKKMFPTEDEIEQLVMRVSFQEQ